MIKINITICDECKKEFEQENLMNVDPQDFYDRGELKKEYENYDGMVCKDCYNNMAQ